MKKHARIAIKSVDLPDDIIEQIRQIRMDPKYNYLNDELDDNDPDLRKLLQTCTPDNMRLIPEDNDGL